MCVRERVKMSISVYLRIYLPIKQRANEGMKEPQRESSSCTPPPCAEGLWFI